MPLGETLVAAKLITEDDVVMALARQRKLGGTLGDNLVGLGRIAREQLESFLETGPPKIATVAETGLDEMFLQGLVLRVMYAHGLKTPSEVADVVRLSVPIVRDIMERLRGRALLEPLGADATGRQLDLRYGISAVGREWVQEGLKQTVYTGPAPVPLAAWQAQVERANPPPRPRDQCRTRNAAIWSAR